jgi:hypothetical protein
LEVLQAAAEGAAFPVAVSLAVMEGVAVMAEGAEAVNSPIYIGVCRGRRYQNKSFKKRIIMILFFCPIVDRHYQTV